MIQSQPLRILLVTPTLPYPPNWGFGIRVYQFLRLLSRTHRVSLVCYASPGEEDKIAALKDICHSVHTVPAPFNNLSDKRLAQFLSLFNPHSFQTASLLTGEMQTLLTRLMSAETFDIVQIESSQLGSYQFNVPGASRQPVIIVDEHNLEYELLQRMYQTERSPLRKFYNLLEYQKFRREEEGFWRKADACILTSVREQEVLREKQPGKPTHCAPNGVDIEYFQPSSQPVNPDSLVFTGLISYRPNTDAVLFFMAEVLPQILKVRPSAVFTIVGLEPPEEVLQRAKGNPNIIVTGKVPDVRPYIQGASVFVVPLRMGSGTRLKVLEGMAMGKPMVSTSLGCEGINVRDGEHLIIKDDPKEFANAVLRLMEDRELANRLGGAGRVLVENHYSWESIIQQVEEFQAQLLAKSEGLSQSRILSPTQEG